MRIVIDMQGFQGESMHRGIGRYTLSLVDAIIRHSSKHEIFLALNGSLPDSIDKIRTRFKSILPQENICIWYSPGPTEYLNNKNQ